LLAAASKVPVSIFAVQPIGIGEAQEDLLTISQTQLVAATTHQIFLFCSWYRYLCSV
jgi:hypothetical protein